MGNKPDILDEEIKENKELNIWEALVPVVVLIGLLAYNVFWANGELLGGYSNHYILLIGGGVALVMGLLNQVSIPTMLLEVWDNLRKVFVPIVILLLVGALAGTWMISGVVPAMVYYGLQILNPTIFLAAAVIICAIISLATGSSWTTSATVGIALIGMANAMGVSPGMTAGAVVSGAYFGDKMSPLSDTTNLAPAMAGSDLFTHIRYMSLTTVPSILIALLVFIILGFTITPEMGSSQTGELIHDLIVGKFNISPWLLLVPAFVIGLVLFKVKPILALSAGALMGGVFAVIFQPQALGELAAGGGWWNNAKAVAMTLFYETGLALPNHIADMDLRELFTNGRDIAGITGKELEEITKKADELEGGLNKLVSGKGMAGMLWTVYLVVCAMVFGGIMEAIGALARISASLMKMAKSTFGLFASTVGSCLALNVTASDQYLAIVIPGKMFAKAYEEKGLAPENLSRTLEDAGTVTSVLIPWNTCGAYQSSVLGVSVRDYFIYAIFNWLSPFTTLFYAAFHIKIKQLRQS